MSNRNFDPIIIDDPGAVLPSDIKETLLKWNDVLKSRIENVFDPLPDYYIQPSTHHLFDQLERLPRTKNPKRAFFQGCLSVLNLLGDREVRSHEDIVKLARILTHEARHFLDSEQ